ncbi:MAG: hypothetical protein MPW15_19340 [Candidatus Manganitrophus sp.]|nr:hypothetical protein [Candidatus Manganitrophus sp.]
MCEISSLGIGTRLLAEVVGFRENKVLLMPLGELAGIGPGSSIVSRGHQATAAVGESLLGRVIDGLGNPIDGKGPLKGDRNSPALPLPAQPPSNGNGLPARWTSESEPSTDCLPAGAGSGWGSSPAAASGRVS